MDVLEDLTHLQLVLIAAVLVFPAAHQAFYKRSVYWLWMMCAMLALIGLVVLW